MIYQLIIAQRNSNVAMSSEYPKSVLHLIPKNVFNMSQESTQRGQKFQAWKDLQVITIRTFCIVCECKSNTQNQKNDICNP